MFCLSYSRTMVLISLSSFCANDYSVLVGNMFILILIIHNLTVLGKILFTHLKVQFVPPTLTYFPIQVVPDSFLVIMLHK